MNFLNMTAHDITIVRENQPDIEIKPCGYEARINTETNSVIDREIDGVPLAVNYVHKTDELEVVEKIRQLLEDNKAEYAIVSSFVQNSLKACHIWYRILAPDTDPHSVIRNEEGQIIGVKQLLRYTQYV